MSMETLANVLSAVALVISCASLVNIVSCFIKARKIAKNRDEAWAKYDNLVGVIFSATMEYRRQCEIPEIKERALMQHAVMCELLFRAGLAGDYREFVESVTKCEDRGGGQSHEP